MRLRRATVLCAAAIVVAACPAGADVIYDNGTYLVNFARASDFDFGGQVADDFQLADGQNTITDIHWYGVYRPIGTREHADDFTIRIFADDGGTAETVWQTSLQVGNVSAVDIDNGIYEYSVDIAPVTLTANTTYWLSIVNDTAADINDNWGWSWSAETGNSLFRSSDGVAWGTLTARPEMAFYLTGGSPVPEPATMALFGMGLAGLAVRLRRRAAG